MVPLDPATEASGCLWVAPGYERGALPTDDRNRIDEATAAAEAMTMAQRMAKSKATAFFVDENCHPQNIAVIKTRAAPLGIEVIVGSPDDLDPASVGGGFWTPASAFGDVRRYRSRRSLQLLGESVPMSLRERVSKGHAVPPKRNGLKGRPDHHAGSE